MSRCWLLLFVMCLVRFDRRHLLGMMKIIVLAICITSLCIERHWRDDIISMRRGREDEVERSRGRRTHQHWQRLTASKWHKGPRLLPSSDQSTCSASH